MQELHESQELHGILLKFAPSGKISMQRLVSEGDGDLLDIYFLLTKQERLQCNRFFYRVYLAVLLCLHIHVVCTGHWN